MRRDRHELVRRGAAFETVVASARSEYLSSGVGPSYVGLGIKMGEAVSAPNPRVLEIHTELPNLGFVCVHILHEAHSRLSTSV